VGASTVEFTLTPACDVSAADRIRSNEPGVQRYEANLRSSAYATHIYRFAGGCITYRFAFPTENETALVSDAEQAFDFEPRATLVRYIDRNEGLALCGAGAPCSP
jgi:hypothetical protein